MLKLKIINNPKPLKLKTQINFPEVVLGKMQEKTIIPKTTFQEVLPDKNYDGLSKISVEAVTNEIDENIKSENIKKNISILGVQGNIEELKGTKLEITKNGTYTPEEPYNAFTEVEANVESDPSEYFNNIIPKYGTYDNMRPSVQNLVIRIPSFTIYDKALNGFCESFYNLKKIDTIITNQNIVQLINVFIDCLSLEEIPYIDTSKCTTINNLFRTNVTKKISLALKKMPKLNMSSATSLYNMFYISYYAVELSNFTDLGGFENLGQAYLTTQSANYNDYKLDLHSCKALTHDSLMNVGNNLYDIASKGCKTQQVIIGSTNIAKLNAEELLVFTNKGFSVS